MKIVADRQTYRLICHIYIDLFVIKMKDIYVHVCIDTIVNLFKSYDNIHRMTYTAKIMLGGIAKIITGYFDNINDYYFK